MPAGGRVAPAPAWPLPQLLGRERELWEALWRRPQAIMWERAHRELEVAIYVRRLAEAEEPGSSAALNNLVVRMQGELQLTEDSMRKARWRIVVSPLVAAGAEYAAEPEQADAVPARNPPARRGSKSTTGSAQERLKVIRGGQGAAKRGR